ncbi:MAG: hemerythrin domain-containing protein [Caulobacteraceae bacterium]|nr:hemerythrin domain-containing protein [Caulobacter sp.]
MDITQLILDDHASFRKLFAQIEQIDRKDTKSLQAVWTRLRHFLDTHAQAEEELFYPQVLKLGTGAGGKKDAADETEDAIDDHNDIRDTAEAVEKEEVGSDAWFEAVDKCNCANSDHMAEEEREALTDFRRHSDLQLRHDLAVKFAAYEAKHVTGVKPVDKDAQEYIAANS